MVVSVANGGLPESKSVGRMPAIMPAHMLYMPSNQGSGVSNRACLRPFIPIFRAFTSLVAFTLLTFYLFWYLLPR